MRIPDITIDRGHWGGSLQTAGRVHVVQGATVRASLIVASGDMLIEGNVHAMLIAGGTIRVTATGQLRGGARCASLVVEPGAVVRGGPFESPSAALGTVDIEQASRSVPGKGPAASVAALDPEPRDDPKPVIIKIPTPAPRRPASEPRLRVVP